jgi:hypothetical protein
VLDASRGCAGDPADDVSCMAINYLFFALGHPGAWQGALRALWFGFWEGFLLRRPDRELLAERALAAERFELSAADAVFG